MRNPVFSFSTTTTPVADCARRLSVLAAAMLAQMLNLSAHAATADISNAPMAAPNAAITRAPAVSVQKHTLDRVVAVVNDTPILQSQLDTAMAEAQQMLAAQNRRLTPEQLRRQVLDQLILQQIQLDIIKRQGIRVDDSRVNAALLNLAKQQGIDSLAQLQQQLDREQAGSYQALRQQVSQELAMQTLQQQQVARRIKISDQDVDMFLASPESRALDQVEYRTLHVLVPYPETGKAPTSAEQHQALQVADKIADALKADQADVNAVVADAQAGYPAEIQGGDMGFHRAGELPRDLSRDITALRVGQVTAPLPTARGLNVIKLVEKQGNDQQIIDQWQVRHILISPSVTMTNELAKQQIESLYEQLRQGADFATLAATYSKDPGSANNGGSLGWVGEDEMVPQFEQVMKNTEVNDFSTPFETQYGWHILKVEGKRQHDVTDIYRRNKAREALYQRLAPQALEDWLQELRAQAYVNIMPEAQTTS